VQVRVNVGVPSIGWEYAPDSWALVQYPAKSGVMTPPDVREILMSMATAVRFDRTTPLRVPFRIGYLPADMRPSPSNRTDTQPVTGSVSTWKGRAAGACPSPPRDCWRIPTRRSASPSPSTVSCRSPWRSTWDNPRTWLDAETAIPLR
jgi:hypothetical protein